MSNILRRGSHASARALLFFSAVAMLVLVGAACGSSSGSSSSVASSNAATTAATAASADSTPSAAASATPESSEAEAEEYGSPSAGTPTSGSATTAQVKTSQDSKLGTILTDAEGRTLYIYKKDAMNVSNCSGGCAQNWPPLTTSGTPSLTSGIAGTLGTITRDDGTKQVTYNGMPLYYFKADSKPGDTNGQDVGDVWYVVNPSAQ